MSSFGYPPYHPILIFRSILAMSVLSIREYLRLPDQDGSDRQSDEPSPLAPVRSLFLDRNFGLIEDAVPHVPISSGFISSGPTDGGDIRLPLLQGDTNRLSKPPPVLDHDKQALRHLLSSAVSQDELPSVIETIISNAKAANTAGSFRGSDAQTFIDIIDEASYHITPSLRNQSIGLF